jgi:hypothetical protein
MYVVLLFSHAGADTYSYYVLPTISLDGVLHIDVLTRAWTGEEFWEYVDILLDNMNPYLQRNSVLVMDNASAHHSKACRR